MPDEGSISHDIQRPDDENCHTSQQSTADESYERALIRATAAPMIFFPARAHLDHRIKPAAMRVLMSMCWHLNEEFTCWPGQNTIAAELGITKQAVCKSIAQLIELGYVEIARRGFRGTGQTNLYRVNIQRHARNSPDNSAGNSAENNGNSGYLARNSPPTRGPRTPNNSHSQPVVDSIVNLTLTHSQPQVVQKYNHEDNQRRSSSEGSLLPTSLAQRANSTPPTVTAPPERRTRERFDSSALRRDPLYIALAEHLPEPQTYDEWRTWAAMIGRLHRIQVSAADIPTAVKGYGLLYPNAVMTIRALVNQWAHIREGKTREQVAASIRNRNTAQAERAAQQRRSEQRGEYLQLVRDTLGLGPDDPLPPEFDDYARD